MNKNENSIVTVSKAYPIINDVVQNLDAQIGFQNKKSSHKRISEEEDLQYIVKLLRRLRPFRCVNGRVLEGYRGINSSVFTELKFHTASLEDKVLNIANLTK